MRVSEKEAERHGGPLTPSGPEPQAASGARHVLPVSQPTDSLAQAASGPEQLALITERKPPACG